MKTIDINEKEFKKIAMAILELAGFRPLINGSWRIQVTKANIQKVKLACDTIASFFGETLSEPIEDGARITIGWTDARMN